MAAIRSLDTVWTLASARVWLLIVAAGSSLVLALGFIAPAASYDPTMRASVETAITLCALAAAALLSTQFARAHRLRDLLLFAGLLTLALLYLVSDMLPAMLHLSVGSSFSGAAMWGNVFVAGTLAAAALVPADRVFRAGVAPRTIAAGLAGVAVGVAELGGLLLHNQLGRASAHPVEGLGSAMAHPLGVVLVLVSAGLFGVTAGALARRSETETRRVVAPLAGASILLAAGGLYGLALPVLPPDWIAPGLGLRVLAWALVLIAVIGRELDVRARLSLAAVTAERRRIAGNLHDGVAQDLAFIVAHGKLLARHLGAEHPLTVAASRALAVSRTTITELQDSSGSTVHDGLESVARDLSDRFEIEIALEAHGDTELEPEMHESVVRIAREAIVNAARHGQAKHVSVSLRPTGASVVLRVRDDGCGIAHAACDGTRDGFGLRSMRERAAVAGGHLILGEPASGGTELEVDLPLAAS